MDVLATTLEEPIPALARRGLHDVCRIAFEQSAVGIVITALSGEHLHVNRAFCDFVGYSADELKTRRMLDLTHPDDRPTASAYRDRLMRGEIAQASWERRFVHKSGLTFWALVTTTLVREPDGDPAYFISQALDIGDRKQAEEALRAAEGRFRAMIGAMRDVIVVVDGNGRYVDVAPSATEMLHRAPSELLGRRLHDVFPTAQADRILGWVQQTLEHNAPVEVSYDLEIRGERFWFDATMLPQGKDRVVWIARDATKRRRTEQALKESEEQLRQALKMEAVGQLAGGVAHDFNNLLMAIMSNAELAAIEVPPSSQTAEYVDEIKNASRRARALTQQLLAFSRKQMLQAVVLDLNDVVRQSQLMVRRLVGPNVLVQVSLDPQLGRVRADPDQLSQVLLNLAVNARDAMPMGGTLTIATGNRAVDARVSETKPGLRAGLYVTLSVRDTGTGITREVLSRVFEPFFTTKALGQGTGLGLATAYGVIKQSGGYIDVETEVGAGTEFIVMLPVLADASDAKAPAIAPPKPLVADKHTVLLVEDEPAVRDATKRILARQGYAVIEAANGVEAVAQWDAHSTDIDTVLTDVVMPAMGGVDLVRKLRSAKPGLRVVFMSGYTQGALGNTELENRATKFLPKPFSAEQLVGALKGVYQNST